VIDDDVNAREALITLLNEEGYEARGAADGTQALCALRSGYRPALLLLDMMMPNMDGWDFRTAQQRDLALAHIPVVVITAVVNPALEAKKLHAVAGFRKPFDVYSLLEVVSEFCSRSR
jgi:CheY-like chemotaxis protein